MKHKAILAMVIAGIISMVPCNAAYADDYIWADDVYQMCEEIAKPYHISPEFIQAMCWAESRYMADADNGSCIGMMQINPKYHKERMQKLGVTDLYDPYSNILVGTDYIAELFEDTDDDYLVLMQYNMGNAKANKLFDAGKYTDYAEDVCCYAIALEREHGK